MRHALGPMLALLAISRTAAAQDEALSRTNQQPPTSFEYLQYGVALVAEADVSAGDVCPSSATMPCIFGSGGGLAVRVGYRSRGPWYAGGAYESSRHEASNLMRLAILQQLRAESRYYFDEGARFTPYAMGGGGAAIYGNEWGAQTGGVTAFFGGGFEFQLNRTTVVGAALAYRPFLFRGWTDSADQKRADRFLGFGFAHVVAIELVVEV